MKIKISPHNVGTSVLVFDDYRINCRRRMFLGLKASGTEGHQAGQQSSKGGWVPPGGHFEESDDNLVACAQRGLREETGWKLPLREFAKVGVLNLYLGQGRGNWKTAGHKWEVHVFYVIMPAELIDKYKCGKEFIQVGWFPTNCLPFDRMMEGDKIWMPGLIDINQHLKINLLLDQQNGKLLKSKIIPADFDPD